MADIANFASEKLDDPEDGTYDPDLEARLYAEIYYSNEREIDPPTDQPAEKSTPSFSSEQNISTLGAQNEPSQPFVEDRVGTFAQAGNNPHLPEPRASASNQDNCRYLKNCSDHRWVRGSAVRNKSLLQKRERYWLSGEKSAEKSTLPPSFEPTDANKAKSNLAAESSVHIGNETRVVESRVIFSSEANDRTSAHSSLFPPRCSSQSTRKSKKRSANKSYPAGTKAFAGTKFLRGRQPKKMREKVARTELSKYEVSSKTKKLRTAAMKDSSTMDCDLLEISSDSDSSIFEVPVPAKAPPPVILLTDSENSSDDESDNFCPEMRVDSSSTEDPMERITNESRVSNEAPEANNSMYSDSSTSGVQSSSLDNTDLMLNCTAVQHSASSLEEIRQIRETERAKTQDHNTKSYKAVSSNNSSFDQPIASCSSAVDVQVEHIFRAPADLSFRSLANGNERERSPQAKRSRTRASCLPQEWSNSNVLDRNKEKSTVDKSYTEYFFSPMSKKLQAFYNNPWGGENLNVVDIQSRMPANPKFWAILDADLVQRTRRTGKACTRCRSRSHIGRKCPEKPKKPCCCMCGTEGHVETRCPQTMCLTCGRKYTSFRATCAFCTKLLCNSCGGIGHTMDNCPDLWRKYHDTTSEMSPLAPRDPTGVMKPAQNLSCCNCAKKGHDATQCRQLRWSNHFPTPMFVTSYTQGPTYEPSNRVRIENPPLEIAQSSRLPDAPDFSQPQPGNIGVLFECSNTTAITARISKRLDDLENANLHGFLAGKPLPGFLRNWQGTFPFNLRIVRDEANKITLEIEAEKFEVAAEMEKIVVQWATRTDEEKKNLKHNHYSYAKLELVKKRLENTVAKLQQIATPAEILKDIAGSEKGLKHTLAAKDKCKNLKTQRRQAKNVRVLRFGLKKKRSLLITSLYVHSYIENGQKMVKHFCELVDKMFYLQRFESVEHYLQIIFLGNEIFTYRENDAIRAALKKVSDGMPPKKMNLSLETRPSNDAVALQNLESNDLVEKSDLPIAVDPLPENLSNGDKFYVDVTPSSQNSQHKAGQAQNSTNANSNSCPVFTPVQNSFIPPLIPPELLPNFYNKQNLASNPTNKIGKEIGDKICDTNKLVINLKGKQRKVLRREVRRAVEKANTTDSTFLHEMATVVAQKLHNGSLRVKEVGMFHRAIAKHKSTHRSPKKKPNNGKS